MFTGIIESTGSIERFEPSGGDWRLRVRAPGLDFSDVRLGDSIAVSGVCLTVVEQGSDWFSADVSRETINCTAMASFKAGDLVNLEKALPANGRLGGHLVSGHVDGLAELLERRPDGRSERLRFRVPAGLARYIVSKGSVCLDGISLTVNTAEADEFSVNIIPHTAAMTTLRNLKPGARVNLEVDLIGRYLERLLEGRQEAPGGLTLEFLSKNGFRAD